MTITREEIGARLRARRKQREWSLTELAERSGINNGSLSKIERGTQSITTGTLQALADAYGIDIAEVIAPIEVAPPGVDDDPCAGDDVPTTTNESDEQERKVIRIDLRISGLGELTDALNGILEHLKSSGPFGAHSLFYGENSGPMGGIGWTPWHRPEPRT